MIKFSAYLECVYLACPAGTGFNQAPPQTGRRSRLPGTSGRDSGIHTDMVGWGAAVKGSPSGPNISPNGQRKGRAAGLQHAALVADGEAVALTEALEAARPLLGHRRHLELPDVTARRRVLPRGAK